MLSALVETLDSVEKQHPSAGSFSLFFFLFFVGFVVVVVFCFSKVWYTSKNESYKNCSQNQKHE